MAAHNIRWGELVAGILIVVCSIGLVISLWNTLTAAHRLLPAAVFLTAAAAIEGAGLYTLRRWKLRHTSRAVLVIGTMLIPLSMMAGIAVAGRGAGAISLDQASTWGVVAAGWMICGALIYFGGRALVRRGAARWWTLAILLPTAMLPLVPAVARLWGQSAAWMLLAAAMGVALAIVFDARQARRDRRLKHLVRRTGGASSTATLSLLPGVIRRRMLLGAVAVYAMAVLTVMLTLRLGAAPEVLVPLGIGWIPALAAAATSALSMRTASRSGTARTVAVTVASIAGIVALGLFPPSLHTLGWATSYTLLLAASTVLFSWLLRTPLATVVAPLAIGLFAPLAAVHWIGGVAWDDSMPLWRRYASGESLLSLMAVTAATVGLSHIPAVSARWGTEGRRLLWRSGCALAAATILVGVVVGLGPSEWLGVLPRSLVIVLLGVIAILTALMHSRGPHAVEIAASATLAAWATALIPLDVWYRQPLGIWIAPLSAVMIGSGWSVGLLGELSRFMSGRDKPGTSPFAWAKRLRTAAADSTPLLRWWHVAAGMGTVGAMLSAVVFPYHAAAGLLAAALAAALLIAAAVRTSNSAWLSTGQLATLLAMALAAVWLRPEWFLRWDAWRGTDALFATLTLLATFATFWAVLRLLAPFGPPHLSRPLRRDGVRIDGFAAGLTVGLWVIGGGIAAYRVFAATRLDLPAALPEARFVLSAMIAIGLAVGLLWRVAAQEQRERHAFGSAAEWRLAAMFTLLTAVLLVTILVTGHGLFAVASIGWAMLLSAIALAGGIWAWGRSGTDGARADLLVALRGSAIFAAVAVAGAAITLAISTHEVRLSGSPWQLGTHQWTLATLTAWSLIATLVLATTFKLVHSYPTGYLAAALAPATAVLAWIWAHPPGPTWMSGSAIGVATALLAHVMACGFTAAGCMAWLEARAWPRTRRGISLEPSWHLALVGITAAFAMAVIQLAMVWTVASDRLDAVWLWAGTYAFAAGLLIARAPRIGARREDLVFLSAVVGSGPAAAAAIAAGWLPAYQGWACVTSIWLAAALVGGVLSLLRRRTVPAAMVIGLLVAVALSAAFDHSRGLAGLILWCTSTVAICGFAPALFARLRLVGAGQAVAAVGAGLGLWLIAAWIDRADHGFAAAALGLACVAVLWRVTFWRWAAWGRPSEPQDAAVGQAVPVDKLAEKVSTGTSAGTRFIDAFFAAGALLMTAVLVASRFPGILDRAGVDMVTGLLSTAALLLLIGSAPLRMRPLGSLAGAYLATQLLMLLGVAGVWREGMTVSPLAVAVSAGVLLSGLWVWAWPLRRQFGILSPAARSRESRWRLDWDAAVDRRATIELLSMLLTAAAVTIGFAAAAVIGGLEPNSRWLMIGSVAGYGWLVAVAAAWFDDSASVRSIVPVDRQIGDRLRIVSVLVFTSALLLSAAGLDPDARPWSLLVAMRMLMAGVILVPMSLWVAPFMFALGAERWGRALRLGAALGGGIAAGSLGAMLTLEWQLRNDGVVAEVPLALVMGIALLLAVLSAITALIGLRPNGLGEMVPPQSDAQRRWWLRGAEAIGGIAWLHVYLCRPDLATIGLRPYWPYLVLGLAFVSAGLAEWGRRRGDAVVGDTLRQTALYLPLIPLIGFWLVAGRGEWTFAGGAVSYAPLLMVTAILYAGLAILWRRALFPRVAGIVVANLALWVVLAQTPNFDFLTHPQFWLIPPAVCVLFAAHVERHRLDATMLTAIRYAATLVIYISSTADVLLSEMGSQLSGPIILVVLALAGMAAGAALRIRAFLYLGTLFVLIGVLSMVWHAQQAIDQVWPWWVFGITTGVLLLVGLMAIEKNKPKLRYWADSLAAWER